MHCLGSPPRLRLLDVHTLPTSCCRLRRTPVHSVRLSDAEPPFLARSTAVALPATTTAATPDAKRPTPASALEHSRSSRRTTPCAHCYRPRPPPAASRMVLGCHTIRLTLASRCESWEAWALAVEPSRRLSVSASGLRSQPLPLATCEFSAGSEAEFCCALSAGTSESTFAFCR